MSIELAERPANAGFIVSEREGPYATRDAAMYGPNLNIDAGTVLGSIGTPASETVSVAADADNAGNGTITLDAAAPLTAAAKDGGYRVVFTAPTAFTVTDPNGKEIGKGTVGPAFAKDIKFVVAAGANAFVANDAFTVLVGREAIKDELYVPLNLAANDGSQVARAIAYHRVVSGVAPVTRTIWNGPGEVRASDLIWPAGITPAQQAEAIQQLRGLGIKLR